MDRLAAALAEKYRIVREIGAGGMATVYLADDLKHGRQVALKVLRPELAATMGPDRFFREIQVAARLQHPHILPLHDSGEADGFLFFVMPFVTGESLRERLNRVGELPVADAIRILTEVADALSYSHAEGVVHRDIKPDNVMLSGRHALVTDFGVAKAVSDAAARSTVTTAGVALGTPTYMAPEQAAADPQLDHRVDIYALGVMGYEMLAGRPPFTGMPPQQMLLAHVTTRPEPVRSHRPACLPELEAVIMRCLAKRAADRFQSAEEIVSALEPLTLSSGGITPTQTRPTPATVTGVTAPPTTVTRTRTMIVAGAAVVAALAITGWLVSRADADAVGPGSYERIQLTASGRASAPSLSPDGQRLAYGERVCDAQERCTVDLRIQDISGAGSTTLLSELAALQVTDWSSDGRWLVFVGSVNGRWGQYIIPALGGQPRFLGCCAITFSTDGRSLLLTGPPDSTSIAQRIHWLSVEHATVLDSLMVPQRSGEVLSFAAEVPGSPNLIAHAFGSRSGPRLILMDRSGVIRDSLATPAGSLFTPPLRVVGDGLIIALADQQAPELDLVKVSVVGGSRFGALTTVARRVSSTGFAHISHGGEVLVQDGSPESAVWTLERPSLESPTFTAKRVAQSTAGVVGSILPSGDSILVSQTRPNDPRVTDLSLVPFDGGTPRSLGTHRMLVDWDFEQDGRGLYMSKIAGRGLEISRFDLATSRSTVIATVPDDRTTIESVAGGGFVQVAGLNRVAVHGVPGRTDTTFVLPSGSTGISALEPSPNGREVAIAAWDFAAQRIVLLRMSLADGSVTELARLITENFDAITWLPDNTLLFSIAETFWNKVWYRLPASGGPLHREEIQLPFDATFRFARSGLRGVAREQTVRSDIFHLRGLNVIAPQ